MAADPEFHRIARRLLRDFVVITFALMVALLYPRSEDEEDDVPADTGSPQLQPPTAAVTPTPEQKPEPEPVATPAPAPEAAPKPAEPEETASPKRGFLSVSAVPWAEVRVDGKLLGATPRRSVPLRAGKHTIYLTCPPLAHDTTLSVELQPDQELRVSANMHESPPLVTTQ
jgi:hypothetical protein